MALPTPALQLGSIPSIGIFDSVLNTLNTSPYFIGSMMLMMNLGARFLSLEVSKGQEAFLAHPWVRRSLIFVVFFMGTRSVWVAFWMALIVILLLGYLFNENSALCLFKAGLPGSACSSGKTDGVHFFTSKEGFANNKDVPVMQPGLTPEENDILQKLLAKQARFQTTVTEPEAVNSEKPLSEIYEENLEKVKSLFGGDDH
jgi:hypothetical protein